MNIQEISEKLLAEKIGKTIDVIVDGADDEYVLARSKGDAPEIDGTVFVDTENKYEIGDIIKVKIYDADAYDLYAEIL